MKNKHLIKFIFFIIFIISILSLAYKIQEAGQNRSLARHGNYVDNNSKIEISSGKTRLKAVDSSAWYDANWQYRNKITVSENNNENLTNYQVKINFQGTNSGAADYIDFSKIKAGGDDIRFTSSDGRTLINYWIQSWNNVSGPQAATIWVNVPSISALSTNTVIYVYYGNKSASAVSSYTRTMSKLTADSNTLALFHFDEEAGTTAYDATSNHYNMVLSSSLMRAGGDGGVCGLDGSSQFNSGNSLKFNGTSNYATIENIFDTAPSNGQISFWFKFDDDFNSSAEANQMLFYKKNHTGLESSIQLYANKTTGALTFKLSNADLPILNRNVSTSKTSWTGGTWYHIRAAWGNEGMFIYVNGSLSSGGANYDYRYSFSNGSLADFTIGSYWDGSTRNQYFKGRIDELEISSKHRSMMRSIADYERRKIVSDPWAPYAGNPVISPANTGAWINNVAAESSVAYEDGIYKMLFRGGTVTPGIGYATSKDGLTWTEFGSNPVISGVYQPSLLTDETNTVIKVDGNYYLYASYKDGSGYSLALYTANSLDSTSWTNHGTVLHGGGSGAWDKSIANSHAIKEGDNWYIWYEARNGDSLYKLGYATSKDGISWEKYSGNPILTSIGSVDRPSVKKIGSVYYMVYHNSNNPGSNLPTDISWAYSTDRIIWTTSNNSPIIQRSFQPNSQQVADPWVIETPSGAIMYVSVDQDQTQSDIWAYIAQGKTLYQALFPEPSNSIGSIENLHPLN